MPDNVDAVHGGTLNNTSTVNCAEDTSGFMPPMPENIFEFVYECTNSNAQVRREFRLDFQAHR